MAEHEGSVLPAEVHAVSFAVRPCFAVFAGFELPHPRAVTVGLEAVFPDRPERVAVDVSLVVFAADGGAGRDGTVDKNGSDGDTCGTLIQVVPDTPLVGAQITFAGIRDMPPCFALGDNIIHEVLELLVGQQEFGIGGCAAHRVDAEDTPIPHAERPEHLTDLRQVVYRALIDAGDDIPYNLRGGYESDSAGGTFESQGVLAKPNMVLFKAIAGDRD